MHNMIHNIIYIHITHAGLEAAHKLAGKLAGEHDPAKLPPLTVYPKPLSTAELLVKELSGGGEKEGLSSVYGHGVEGEAGAGVGARLAAAWLVSSGVSEIMEVLGDVVRVCGWVRRVREEGRDGLRRSAMLGDGKGRRKRRARSLQISAVF